jgi:hypothetical protein
MSKMNNIIKTCQGCGIKFKPKYRTQRYCSLLCWNTSAEIRAINREALLERWRNDPEFRSLVSEVMRERWRNNPEYRALVSEVMHEC